VSEIDENDGIGYYDLTEKISNKGLIGSTKLKEIENELFIFSSITIVK
jgi:hypothetical protein